MTYFLDFDRTLFDNDAFQKYLVTLPAWKPFKERMEATTIGVSRDHTLQGGVEREQLWQEVEAWFATGSFSFQAQELQRFVFSDVWDFLKNHGTHSIIVTAGGANATFQKAKVEHSGLSASVSRAVFTPRAVTKGAVIAEVKTSYPAPYLFVDDLAAQLDSAAEVCPDVSLYEMRRDGKEGSGRYPTIRTLLELP